MTAPVTFPADLAELTPQIVESALVTRTPDVRVAGLEVLSAKRCGEGVASTADRALLGLRYAAGTADHLPAHMVLKTMLASPHAPAAMYENEVRFYRELRDTLAIETPRVFGTSFDRATGRFGLLLEDLTAREARFPSVLDPISVDDVRTLLGHLATMHAQYWDSPRFDQDLTWLPTPLRGGMFDVFDTIGLELIEDQVARHPAKAQLIAPLGRTLPELWELLWEVQRQHSTAPTTLLHGDPHLGNTYLLPTGAGLLDWQLMMRGCWAHDVTYLIVTALAPELRRAHEKALLQEYLELLRAKGVTAPPAFDDALEQYRKAALWGLVIGWLICPPENYGPQITEANISRLVTAVQDLGTLAAIEGAQP